MVSVGVFLFDQGFRDTRVPGTGRWRVGLGIINGAGRDIFSGRREVQHGVHRAWACGARPGDRRRAVSEGWLPAGHRRWTVALPASLPLPIRDQSDGG